MKKARAFARARAPSGGFVVPRPDGRLRLGQELLQGHLHPEVRERVEDGLCLRRVGITPGGPVTPDLRSRDRRLAESAKSGVGQLELVSQDPVKERRHGP